MAHKVLLLICALLFVAALCLVASLALGVIIALGAFSVLICRLSDSRGAPQEPIDAFAARIKAKSSPNSRSFQLITMTANAQQLHPQYVDSEIRTKRTPNKHHMLRQHADHDAWQIAIVGLDSQICRTMIEETV
jgi:hypothetical protein